MAECRGVAPSDRLCRNAGDPRGVDGGRKEKRLPLCDLYVTLEPCPMCDPKGGGVEHGPKIFQQPTCHHRPEVFGGFDETKSATLLKTFPRVSA